MTRCGSVFSFVISADSTRSDRRGGRIKNKFATEQFEVAFVLVNERGSHVGNRQRRKVGKSCSEFKQPVRSDLETSVTAALATRTDSEHLHRRRNHREQGSASAAPGSRGRHGCRGRRAHVKLSQLVALELQQRASTCCWRGPRATLPGLQKARSLRHSASNRRRWRSARRSRRWKPGTDRAPLALPVTRWASVKRRASTGRPRPRRRTHLSHRHPGGGVTIATPPASPTPIATPPVNAGTNGAANPTATVNGVTH